jgi:hypothetical protein
MALMPTLLTDCSHRQTVDQICRSPLHRCRQRPVYTYSLEAVLQVNHNRITVFPLRFFAQILGAHEKAVPRAAATA